MASYRLFGMNQTCTVYGEDPVTGEDTFVLKKKLKCRMSHIMYRTAVDLRKEIMERRVLWYDPSYTMPRNVMIVLDDEPNMPYVPIVGTYSFYKNSRGDQIFNRLEMVKKTK